MSASERLKIYVAHADPVVVQTLTEFLGELGHAVVSVRSAVDLVAQLERTTEDSALVLIQLGLPDLGGVEILRGLHQRFPEIVVVLITNGAGLPVSDAVACGVEAYLREPIRLRELELLVTRRSLGVRHAGSAGRMHIAHKFSRNGA